MYCNYVSEWFNCLYISLPQAAVYKHIATYCTSMDHMEEASEANEEYEQIINNEPEAAFSSESEPESSENTQDGYVQLTPSGTSVETLDNMCPR